MERVNIKETNLKFFNQLPERDSTNLLVIHHTGNENGIDTDPSARAKYTTGTLMRDTRE